MTGKLSSLSLGLILASGQVLAVQNGLAHTPQMGWNNWNSLGCDVSEDLLLDTSSRLVKFGLRDLGYNYVVLDDCWSDGRNSAGRLEVDRNKFPHGMKWVADRLHDQGLLYGMYSSAGHMTCARHEGSLDYEEADAQTFADWGVDYLKYDNCYSSGRMGTAEASYKRYHAMALALNATGRKILYSLCNWGEDYVNSWGVSIANSWRISGDIYDSFARPDDRCSCQAKDPANPICVAPGSHCSVLSIINRVAPYVDRGQPGGWQDLDALEVGCGGMTDEEYKAHFALWSALKSPLLIGTDLRQLTPQALSILNNPAILAVSQDPTGYPASRIARNINVPKDRYGEGETQIWAGPLSGGDQLLLLLNVADTDLEMTAYVEDIFVADGPGGSAPQCSETWLVYDLWGQRMEESVASKILKTSKSAADVAKIYSAENWYNATAMPYREGLRKDDPRLFGVQVGEIEPHGVLTVKVSRHSAKTYRLRPKSGVASKRYSVHRDEL